MTVCPLHGCYTHIGTTRDTCGRCGAHIQRNTPHGHATHARINGRLVYADRSNSAREREQLWTQVADEPTRRARGEEYARLIRNFAMRARETAA